MLSPSRYKQLESRAGENADPKLAGETERLFQAIEKQQADYLKVTVLKCRSGQ